MWGKNQDFWIGPNLLMLFRIQDPGVKKAQKNVKKLLNIRSWDPETGIRKKPIPDP
jgi:hypothetical protein